MKKFVLGILLITIISCNNSESVNYVLFSGVIKNPNTKSLRITDNLNRTFRNITVSDIGVFSDTIFNANGYFRFNDGKESSSMYLKNGDNIHLRLDAKKFNETIVYSGIGSEVNNFLAQKYLIKEKIETLPEVYSLNEKAYLEKINELNRTVEKSLVNLDTDFIKGEKENLKYEHIIHMMRYEGAHRYFTKNDDFKVSESFYDFIKDFNFNDEKAYNFSKAYRAIVRYNFSTVALENSKKENISFYTAALKLVKQYKSKIISNDLLKGLSRDVAVSNVDAVELYNGIIELSTDDVLKERITKRFNKIKKLIKGNVSPAFDNYENYDGGTTSLADFKGKYVYIDIWTTWCEPCKEEIPFLKKIEKQYHNKNIEFVSLSIDVEENHDLWRKMIKEKQLGGVQLMADKNWKSKFVTDYDVSGIPHFILINPAGNIVSSYAPRPSDKKLIDLFNELKI